MSFFSTSLDFSVYTKYYTLSKISLLVVMNLNDYLKDEYGGYIFKKYTNH